MTAESISINRALPKGVMLNAYPDSIGGKLSDIVRLLKKPELERAFSLFYILPTFFNSDLDRGFSVVDYNYNPELVALEDLDELNRLNIMFKFDLILNHLSVRSPQFQDLLEHGDESSYKAFFVDWNEFWHEHGEPGVDGQVVPKPEYLQKLFMRKPGLPVLNVPFPDGTHRPYWNTFYQEKCYREIAPADLAGIAALSEEEASRAAETVNGAIRMKVNLDELDFGDLARYKEAILSIAERCCDYLGQMDVNAKSELVWDFYEETLRKLRDYGAKIIRLDAFAYLHKEPGRVNFFNRPGTWDYLERLRGIAEKYDLIIFPEIHAQYGCRLHDEVAAKGYPIYDFFLPGLLIDALERATTRHLLHWVEEILERKILTINMLGCHDGIPVLDLRGCDVHGVWKAGLLSDEQIDAVMKLITDRGGRIKNLYGPDGKKIAYYQVNATFFSALGEDERRLRLARAIQMFMPGIPQVWYLDLFAGKNDYAAADRGGAAGHKEINRTNLSVEEAEEGLRRAIVQDQLRLIRFRNTSQAFDGKLEICRSEEHLLHLKWHGEGCSATLEADLREHGFRVLHSVGGVDETVMESP